MTDGESHDVAVTVTGSVAGIEGTINLVRGDDEVVGTKNYKTAGDSTYTSTVVFQVSEAGQYKVVVSDSDTETDYDDYTSSALFAVKNVAGMADLFNAGKATQGTDSATGRTISATDGVFTISGVDGETQHKVAPTYVVPEGTSTPVAVQVKDDDAAGTNNTGYFVDNNGVPGAEYNATQLESACKTGAYWVAVEPKADDSVAQTYVGGVLYVKVVLQKSAPQGVYAYDGANVEDTTFTYDAEKQIVNFAAGDGTKLTAATATYYGADGALVGTDGKTAPTDAGSYYAVVDLDGDGAGTETATVPFEVSKLDLSSVVVTVDDQQWTKGSVIAPANILKGASVNGESLADGGNTVLRGKLSLNAGLVDHLGEYTATIAAADAEDENITGTATASFKAVQTVVGDFRYDGEAFADAFPADPTAVLNNAVAGFSVDKIAVYDANGNAYAKSKYSVELTDEDGNAVESATAAGTYFVTVSMNAGSDFALGGKATGKFTVTNGSVDAAKVSVSFDGKTVGTGFAADYDGTNLAERFKVSVTLDGKELVEGEDYKLVFKDKDTGKAVDSVVDVNDGGYSLTVKGVGYAGSATFDFTVSPVTAKALKVDEGAFGGVAWTGEAVAPTILYSTKTAADSAEADWKVLDPEMYSTVYKTSKKDYDGENGEWDGTYTDGNVVPASEVVDAGTYAVIVSLYSDVNNLAFDGSLNEAARTLHFDVVKAAGYVDVPAGAWYADSVYKAKENGFMDGVASGIFAPERAMTRAEFAQTVYNMAHESGEQGPSKAWETYPTQFSDVAPNAWYAKAVEWAARYGIVTGKSATEFDPDGTVTREEIATMLYRYAGNGAKADASALDKFEDKAEVCGWAADAMAWAVSEGVVNGVSETSLAPHADAQRCMIAAMAVRVQPERIENM